MKCTVMAVQVGPDGQANVAAISRLTNPSKLDVLIAGNPVIADPMLEPNGQYLAAAVRPSSGGPSQIELFPFPGVQSRVPVWKSPNRQRYPVFVNDQLLFHIRDQGIYSIDLTFDESGPVIGQDVRAVVTRRFRYELSGAKGPGGRAWDVFDDGSLLMISYDEDEASDDNGAYRRDQIHVVSNWSSELEDRVP